MANSIITATGSHIPKIKVPNEHFLANDFYDANSSVATLPTMLDLLLQDKLDNHQLHTVDIVVFASVGAGMNINSMVYKVH